MNTDLNVYSLAADNGGCGFYRVREPARVAADLGVNITVDSELPATVVLKNNESIVESIDLVDVDVITFQRPMLGAFVKAIQVAQKRGIACVVEIDDHLSAVHPQNMAYRYLHPEYSPTSNYKFLEMACEIADLVVTSTPALAEYYAPHGRYAVLRNCIPEVEFNRPVTYADNPRLGWTGTIQVHPEDLDQAGAHVAAVLYDAADPNFYVVGDGEGIREKLYLPEHSAVIATGWVPREDYMEAMNENIDVGIVPLKVDKFNEGKSYLKSLEFSSQGIPSVVSPTSENRLLSQITGNPVVNKPRDWQKHLKRLMTDRDFYLERSEAVREAVRPMTYENNGHQWVEAWNQAVLHRRKQSVTIGT